MRILIVEDEPKTGEYLRQGLTEAGYIADLVSNGSDGLHLALQGEYSLGDLGCHAAGPQWLAGAPVSA